MSKNITIRDDLYTKLTEMKGTEESFSDVIENLLFSAGFMNHKVRTQ